MVATTDSLLSLSELPPGLEIERVTDIKGIDAFIATNEAVFGNSQEALRNSLVARLSSAPEEMEIFIATVDGVAVSAARVEFLPKREFAFLWGGGTLEQWRGRGIYRALVARRAQEAQRRGFKYLTILASHQSQPILENLGFMNLASVATFSWKPSESTATTS
jgi:GNAT superfamily N-acetyltransferase